MLLTVVVVVQTTLALLAVPPGTTQVAGWRDAVIRGVEDPSGDLERTIGERLATAAPDSVLADDTTAYRLIARGGTVRPFVLPTSPLFDVALSNPRPVIDYILVSTQPGVGPLSAIARTVPTGFVIEAEWPGWRLLRDVEAPPLLSG